MARKTLMSVMLPVALLLAGCASPARNQTGRPLVPRLHDERGRPSLGHLEHRGQRHSLRDLMDLDYRAASRNAFDTEFDPGEIFAGS
jgi:hypothetical protein